MQQLAIATGDQRLGGAQQAMDLTTLRARCPGNRTGKASAGEDHGGGEIARAGSGIGPPRVEQAQQQVEAIALVGAGLVDCRARRKAGGVEQAMQAFQCATP